MTSNALWLLKRQSFLRARERVLRQLLLAMETKAPNDNEIIEEITFSHIGSENVQTTTSKSSRTEYIALNMDSLRENRVDEQEQKAELWRKELRIIQIWLSILESALLVLTPEERILTDRYFNQRDSIELLSQSPLLHLTRSRSTIKRMLKSITQKVAEVISEKASEDSLPRI